MEKLRTLLNQIAQTPTSKRRSNLSLLQRSLIPFLSFASSLYRLALSVRHRLYDLGLLRQPRLPVPVISVGNLTWGGNGKTPMVEFIARWLAESGISPLILTRGYANGDEAKMLQRHLLGTYIKIGIGANRAATAACFIERYGYMDPHSSEFFMGHCFDQKARNDSEMDKVGVAILDDGMQHLSLKRDLEIVMVNGLNPWGNCQLIPLGPLRETLTAIHRADVVVVHHADLASEQDINTIESRLQGLKQSLPVFFTRMAPSFFFKVGNSSHLLSLKAVNDKVVLCVSAIGFADAFLRSVEKLGPLHVGGLNFSDHHLFQIQDYDREPEILKHLDPFEVLVLCSELQFVSRKGCTKESYKTLLKQLLEARFFNTNMT